MHSDNFLDMSNEYERGVYEWLKSRTLQCRRSGCYCAYGHQKGWCNKCGHITQQVMLNP